MPGAIYDSQLKKSKMLAVDKLYICVLISFACGKQKLFGFGLNCISLS